MNSNGKNEQTPQREEQEAPTKQAVALLLYADLMFGVPLQNMARRAGLKPVAVLPGQPLPDGDVLVVDIGARGDWEASVRDAVERNIRVIAFGPHMDAEGRRKAREAGASRVLANSNMARDLPLILEEIAKWPK